VQNCRASGFPAHRGQAAVIEAPKAVFKMRE
jgi:hypothetical protein